MIPPEEATAWSCDKCGQPLKMTKVEFAYMKGNFEVDLPACPDCGLVLVTEDLALGKMAEVERILEDK
jgi:predicted RNA-binding Zn-ribbon protein involved in translation (DUF1610 family)